MENSNDLRNQIEALNLAYAHCIDDDDLERWPDFFVDNCDYQILPRENADAGLPAAVMYCDSRGMLVDRVVALRKANIYPAHYSRHILGGTLVTHINGDVISTQTSYVVFQTRADGETRVYNAGKYVDEIVHENGGLKFRKRICIFDTHRIETLLVTPI